jgi:hypothetical protein
LPAATLSLSRRAGDWGSFVPGAGRRSSVRLRRIARSWSAAVHALVLCNGLERGLQQEAMLDDLNVTASLSTIQSCKARDDCSLPHARWQAWNACLQTP